MEHGQLQSLNVEVTEACPLRCPFCSYDFPDGAPRHLPVDAFAKLVCEAKELGAGLILLSGGEPTAHPQIVELVALVKQAGLLAILSTSGCLLTEALAARLKDAGLDELYLSLAGPTEEIHARYRQGYKKTMKAIDTAKAAGLSVRLNFVAAAGAIDAFDGMLVLAREKGCGLDVLSPKPRMLRDGSGEGRLTAELPTDDQLKAFSARLQTAMENGQDVQVEACFGLMNRYAPFLAGLGQAQGCGAGRYFLAVTAREQVMPCNHLIGFAQDLSVLPGENRLRTYQKALPFAPVCCLSACKTCFYRRTCRPCVCTQTVMEQEGVSCPAYEE